MYINICILILNYWIFINEDFLQHFITIFCTIFVKLQCLLKTWKPLCFAIIWINRVIKYRSVCLCSEIDCGTRHYFPFLCISSDLRAEKTRRVPCHLLSVFWFRVPKVKSKHRILHTPRGRRCILFKASARYRLWPRPKLSFGNCSIYSLFFFLSQQ